MDEQTSLEKEVEEMSISLIKLEWRLVFNPQTQGQKIEATSQPHNESTQKLDKQRRGLGSHPSCASASLGDLISWSVDFINERDPPYISSEGMKRRPL